MKDFVGVTASLLCDDLHSHSVGLDSTAHQNCPRCKNTRLPEHLRMVVMGYLGVIHPSWSCIRCCKPSLCPAKSVAPPAARGANTHGHGPTRSDNPVNACGCRWDCKCPHLLGKSTVSAGRREVGIIGACTRMHQHGWGSSLSIAQPPVCSLAPLSLTFAP